MKLVVQIAAGVVLGWLIITVIKMATAAVTLTAITHAFQDDQASKPKPKPQPAVSAVAPVDYVEQVRLQQQRQVDQMKAEDAARREAARPKAYRWKDKAGVSRIGDKPPPDVPYEVIYLR